MEEFNEDILDGLEAIKEIPDETWRKLLDNAFASLLGKPDIHSTSSLFGGSKPNSAKRAYTAILSIVAKATRNVSDTMDDSILDKIAQNRRDQLNTLFEKNKERLAVRFARLGLPTAPHIVDCKWRLEHVVKISELDETCGPVYRIQLVTDNYDEDVDGRKSKNVEFTCNVQQLQDLVYKLKDAVRHCDKVSSVQ